MLWAFIAATSLAGQLIDVRNAPTGVEFEVVGMTETPPSEIINWEGRPLELMIVADLSISVVVDPTGPATEMREAMLAAYSMMRAHPIPGDELGVTIFAGNAKRWVPLGPTSRPGLDAWLSTFGPTEHAPLPFATADVPRRGDWSEEPTLPTELGIEAFATDPTEGLRNAMLELRRSNNNPLKAVVVLWDGDKTTEWPVDGLLDRIWNHEIHVFTIAVGDIHPDGLSARGGGDVYLAKDRADVAMQRIIGQLRMPEP